MFCVLLHTKSLSSLPLWIAHKIVYSSHHSFDNILVTLCMFCVLLHTKSLPLNVKMKMLFHKCRNSIWCQPTCQQARHISQSDRWLRQASIIDGWSITTIDTAIQFRKISKGKIFLDFKHWKEFLLELSATKKLELTYLISKLEMCGKPAINLTQRK